MKKQEDGESREPNKGRKEAGACLESDWFLGAPTIRTFRVVLHCRGHGEEPGSIPDFRFQISNSSERRNNGNPK
jgi:hypothetical protein